MTYTLATFLAVLLVFPLDYILKTQLIRRPLFWYFHGFVFFMNCIVNGYLTWRPIVLYNPEFFLNIRLGTIPIEDFFYGFALISYNIILFEYFLRKKDLS